ncbi:MAG: BREX system serine/threonine kinase PglW [Phycisphaerae bacterium]|nr:BREX system serine/threonine kinase PglW [Phycisphaerae bacterium]
MSTTRWKTIARSEFPWEQEALDFVRARLPDHEPYRAWSNFEFIADDGSINEVDLLVFTPVGFFLVEIKSNPGKLSGDAHTWTWSHEGRTKTVDNPLFLANQKAKKLARLLQRQRAFSKHRVPFLEPLIFCSAENVECQLQGNAEFHIRLRDTTNREGIMAALMQRKCPGLSEYPRGTFNRPIAKAISRAFEEIGIKPSQRSRRVGDYELHEFLDEGPGFQDFLGKHVALPDTARRIRIYLAESGTSPEQRKTIERAAEREFHLLQVLEHRGVLRALEFTNHELGPAIIFQHFPDAVRLDHYLVEQRNDLTDDLRLELMRQIAETVRFAHEKHVVHRALSPQAVLVASANGDKPRVMITNWQLGYRQAAASQTAITRPVTATIHIDDLVDETSKVFMAPETLIEVDSLGEHHDVFSLGAICYQLFTGEPPAESALALAEKLRAHRGLRVSAVLNGAPETLDQLVQYSTDPDVTDRLDTAEEFIEYLDRVEDELTAPSNQLIGDPTHAKPGDILPGGFSVRRKLGTGSTAIAFAVEKDEREFVVKVAVDVEHNERVRDEGEVLQKLDDPRFVRCHDILQLGDRIGLLLDRAGEKTLAQRIRQEGRLSLDLLERFGEDLLEAVVVLEREGIAHRDIKPDNIGVSKVGRGDALHLVLFDFSLSRYSPENIRAGTPGFLDPFLPLRKPKRWDLQAERFSAAVTLYQMATGIMPTWSGGSDPLLVEAEVTIDAERFDPNLREQFGKFFAKALRRNARDRFDNAQDMLDAWQGIFRTATATLTTTIEEDEVDNAALVAAATTETNVSELGLGAAAVDALDRINVVKVSELLRVQGRRLARMRGVGNKTRKRILAVKKALRERLGVTTETNGTSTIGDDTYDYDSDIPRDQLSIDVLAQRILKAKAKSRNATENTAIEALLGKDDRIDQTWPSQGEVATVAGVTRGRISQILADALNRWKKDPAITAVRDQVTDLLEANGGVMSADELCQALLAARGSIEDEPRRSRLAHVVTRAAVETENAREEPKFIFRRTGNNVLIAVDMPMADYATALGQQADEIAKQDPLIPPIRVVEMLREAAIPPEAEPISDVRLVRLAAAASQAAAVSSRQEIYPRQMGAGRAIKLSQGALVGARFLTVENVQQRVSSRYPQAAPLPGRPQLDKLLNDAGLELSWKADHPGAGAYVSTARNVLSITDASGTPSRFPTVARTTPSASVQSAQIPPEIAEARQFEERLRYAEKDGAFLALTAKPNLYERARQELLNRFDVRPLDLERVFLDSLRQAAEEVGADWNVVVKADAAGPNSTDWRNLNHLIASKVVPKVEEAIVQDGKTVVIYHLNWLGRYDQVVMLSRVQQAVQDGRVHGTWLLIPGSPQTEMPLLDGKAVPVITNNQWAAVPKSWCQNLHRTDPANGNGKKSTTGKAEVTGSEKA